ncbi:S41 family peptidase [uncultured Erythrobacter sp.]|uniref:S41 family peptidase n=1 Tax=uncultured Erythrobacter sp. TaxID=263913 RepID=UPI002625BF89|nr:S41 family peptidase [uncultured Erythrobacter sp.]
MNRISNLTAFIFHAAGLLLLAGCTSASGVADQTQPWLIASDLRSVQQDDGRTDPAVRGVWRSRGYGRILDISEQGVRQYEAGTQCYSPAREDGSSLSEMDSVTYRYFRMLPGEKSAIFQLLRGDTNVVFDRLDSLPAACRTELPVSPRAVSDAFLDAFERHYAFFERRPPDHAARAARLRAQIRPDMGDEELWAALGTYMDGLSDSHTKLIGEVAGERRRIQDGQGETLPRIRSAQGGESEWLVGLIGQTLDRLDEGAQHTGRDRIIWGLIDNRIGYLQIFQMGGFTDRQDFGSDEWADAEMAEFNRIMDEAFAAFDQAGVAAIIVDLSNNRGGWDQIAKAIPGRFTDSAYTGFTTRAQGSGLAEFPHVIEPAAGTRFIGPTYLLTSDVTVSGGELASLALLQNPQVVHVGTKTRGAFSTPLAKRLPNGWLLEVSNETFAAPDGVVYEETGLEPRINIEVYPQDDPVGGHWKAIERIVALAGAQ